MKIKSVHLGDFLVYMYSQPGREEKAKLQRENALETGHLNLRRLDRLVDNFEQIIRHLHHARDGIVDPLDRVLKGSSDPIGHVRKALIEQIQRRGDHRQGALDQQNDEAQKRVAVGVHDVHQNGFERSDTSMPSEIWVALHMQSHVRQQAIC